MEEKEFLIKEDKRLRSLYNEKKKSGASIEELNELVVQIRSIYYRYQTLGKRPAPSKSYEELYEIAKKFFNLKEVRERAVKDGASEEELAGIDALIADFKNKAINMPPEIDKTNVRRHKFRKTAKLELSTTEETQFVDAAVNNVVTSAPNVAYSVNRKFNISLSKEEIDEPTEGGPRL